MTSNPSPGRYHLLLTVDGRPVQHGWWERETAARRKLSSWIGEYGSLPGAHIALTDTETSEQLDAWPAKDAASDTPAGGYESSP